MVPKTQSLLQEAIQALHSGNFDVAALSFKKILKVDSQNFEANFYLGMTYAVNQKYMQAIAMLDRAIQLNGESSEAFINLGICYQKIGEINNALDCFNRAIELDDLSKEALLNRGNALQDLCALEDAQSSYAKAIIIDPLYEDAFVSAGNCFFKMGCYFDALRSYGKALAINPAASDSWFFQGLTHERLGDHEKAAVAFETALKLNFDTPYLLGSLIFNKRKRCSWTNMGELSRILEDSLICGKRVVAPFKFLCMSDSASLQYLASNIFIKDEHPFNPVLGDIPLRSSKKKIRIGYFSSDFRDHPVSLLTAELFELHDKDGFEIIAFDFGPRDNSLIRQRLLQAFNKFIDVRGMSDESVAKLSRSMEIDIAIDLGGLTANARTGIFAYRAAPIQASYIGYLGTMGAKYFDYLIADRNIIPQESEQFYSEKIIYLPCYQVNDSRRDLPTRVFTREDLGLPLDGFIFACFNDNYKISPDVFDAWMNILKKVDGSILFLYAENQWAQANLIEEAELRGISKNRLIFGARLSPNEYLARYQVCDLILDTSPYNSGTTASDALWVGSPVLTLTGESFASRVAASILTALNLPELITNSLGAYQARAIELATDVVKMDVIKKKLASSRVAAPLFDTSSFTVSLEDAYKQMMAYYWSGQSPKNIYISQS